MDSQEQAIPEQSIKPAQEPKKCNHMAVTIILAILAIGGFVFGGIELWQNMQKNDEANELQLLTNQNNCDVITDENGHSNSNESTGQSSNEPTGPGSIEISIKANLKSVVLEEFTEDYISTGMKYTIGVDSLFYVVPMSNEVIFHDYDGIFGGTGISQEKIEREFNFDGEVVQIMLGKFGNGGGEAILILKDDGTVGAIRANDDHTDFIDIQRLGDVSDVVALYQGYRHNGAEVFAVRSDGGYYTLYEKIWGQ